MAETPGILAVDDDARICDMLSRYLSEEGFRVDVAENGQAMRRHMAQSSFDLIILDLMIPGDDGLSLARELRAVSGIPIIMITGKGDPVDRTIGLEVGADDYIAKPFHLREVLARVRAVLRRKAASPSVVNDSAPENAGPIAFAGWKLDLAKRELRNSEGEALALTSGEFDLLAVFVCHPAQVLNRDQLMDQLRGQDWSPFDRSIDTQVGRLRKKIERDPSQPELIKTVRGAGYIFTAEVEQD